MKTEIASIPHSEHRYPTLGDYWCAKDGTVFIRVSALPDWRYEFLIALHELIEEAVTRHRGIREPAIKAFDEAHLDMDDPGMSPEAPYHREHVLATAIEMLVAQELGVVWSEYEAACAAVEPSTKISLPYVSLQSP